MQCLQALPTALNLRHLTLSFSPTAQQRPPINPNRTKYPSSLLSATCSLLKPSNPNSLSPSVLFAISNSQSSLGISSETAEWAMQDFYALRKDVEIALVRVEEIRVSAGLELLEADLVVLEKKAADSSLWDDPAKAQETLLALTDVKDKIKLLSDFKSQMIEFLLKHSTIKNQINALNSNNLTALDVVEQKRWERDYWELKSYLVGGGAKTSKDLQKRQPSTLRWKLSEHDSNWLEAKESSILVVAVLIATVTFDAVRNPPGGLWQDDKDNKYFAGDSILSSKNHLSYLIFSFSNQVAFFASSSTILFMLIKARIPAKHLVRMLAVLMWIGTVSMWIAFVSALYSIGTGDKKTKNFQNLTCIIIYALAVVSPVGITWIMACFKSILRRCRGHGEGRNQIP